MTRWDLTVTLDPASVQPLFLQLARAIATDIRRHRLNPGDPLPGTRAMAQRLGIHRNTVIASYAELAAEGLVRARPGGGTFIAEPPPEGPRSARHPATAPSYALDAPLPFLPIPDYAPGTLVLAKGAPDVRLLPADALARAYRRALKRHGPGVLTYGDPRGHESLRRELATMLARMRGIAASTETVMVTRGSQMALDLTARALVTPGDVVAVEALGHRPAWTALRLAGAQLVPVPVDAEGLDVAALQALLARQTIRAVYVTPHHQFPTTTVMSAARRRALGALAMRHRFAVVEDDYDHEFHYEGRPVLPLAAGEHAANVIYVGTLSKVLAPGLRAGFVVAPRAVVDRMASVRVATDLQGDLAMECAVAELFDDGELFRHVRRMRLQYEARRDALVAALRRHLAGAVDFRVPDGGMALWVRIEASIDVEAWARAGERAGVVFRGARMYDFEQRYQPFARLGFTFHNEPELEEAVRRMVRALDEARPPRQIGTSEA